jgi:Patatin-like phospholipase
MVASLWVRFIRSMRAQRSKHTSGATLLVPRSDNLSVSLKPAERIVADEGARACVLSATHHGQKRPHFECIALLLQSGGALGAYQAGVCEAQAEAELLPDWVAGMSVGAINSALIAGNPPTRASTNCGAFGSLSPIPRPLMPTRLPSSPSGWRRAHYRPGRRASASGRCREY